MQENNDDNNLNNNTESSGSTTTGDVIEPNNNENASTTTTSDSSETSNDKPQLLTAVPGNGKKKKSKESLMLLIVAILLIVGGAAVWWLTNNKKAGNSNQKAVVTKDIDVLTVGTTEGPASVYFPDEGLLGMFSVLNRQIYEGLTGFEDKKIVPLLAQSWTNPDEKTWVFKIRPNIKFHTGKEVKAQQIKESLEDLKKYDFWGLYVSTIESVEVTGDLELTIKTTEPDALMLNRLTLAYITDLTASEKAGKNGTGAYMADETADNNDLSTTLIAFDDYYGGRAKTRKLIYKVFPDDKSGEKAFKNKEVDVLDTLPYPQTKTDLTNAGFSSIEFDSPGTFGLFINSRTSKNTILKNIDFRKALALSINRQSLVDELGNDLVPAFQVLPKSLPGHDDSVNFPDYDKAAAKTALDKSGYNNTPIEFLHVSEVQIDPPVLIKQLKEAGFNIKEKAFVADEIDDALDDLRDGKFDLFAGGYSSDVQDARDVLGGLLHSSEQTYSVFEDEVYDKLLTDSDKEFDPVKRTELLQKANNYITEKFAFIPLRNFSYISYYSSDLTIQQDFLSGANIGTYYRNVGRIVK